MRQVWMTRVGKPETLEIRETADPRPAADEALVRVHAAGINFADIMARLGLYPDAPKFPAVMGYEVAGVIEAVGTAFSAFRPGDKVIGLCQFGGYSERVVLKAPQLFSLPDSLTYAQGAAIPVNYLTAYQLLFAMGSVRPGQTVLVHSAGGGVGLAALDLCQIAGAKVIGTASASKHAELLRRGVTAAIDYRTQDFETEVKRLTEGRGVDLILDAVGGDSWAKGLRCLAPTGRIGVFGLSGAAATKSRNPLAAILTLLRIPWFKLNPITLMNENKGIYGVNLGHLWHEPAMVRQWLEQILAWHGEGKIHPTVDREFPFEQAAQAHHHIQDRKNFGKVVLVSG